MLTFTALEARNANYVCAALSLFILCTRVVVSCYRKKPFDLSFFLVLLSIAVIVCRITVVYFYLRYGTASDALSNARYFNVHNMDDIKKGSILSLVARVLITASCWLQICLLLRFYNSMMYSIRWVARMIKLTWFATIATFIAVILATLLECRPFHLYWQVSPDPGKCVKGYIQIFLQCLSNIVLDLSLLIISYPILAAAKNRSWKQHLRIATLFMLGTFCIIVTVLRLVSIYDNRGAQPTRSFWASVAMAVSTFVANAPTIYGDLRIAKRRNSQSTGHRASRANLFESCSEFTFPGRLPPNQHLQIPDRVITNETRGSQASSASATTTKEWFDHFEYVK